MGIKTLSKHCVGKPEQSALVICKADGTLVGQAFATVWDSETGMNKFDAIRLSGSLRIAANLQIGWAGLRSWWSENPIVDEGLLHGCFRN